MLKLQRLNVLLPLLLKIVELDAALLIELFILSGLLRKLRLQLIYPVAVKILHPGQLRLHFLIFDLDVLHLVENIVLPELKL